MLGPAPVFDANTPITGDKKQVKPSYIHSQMAQ